MRRPNPKSSSGSVLIWTILVITILSLAAAELLHVMSTKYYSVLHTATWQEALVAAESGVDLAVRELRKSLYPAPNGAWDGWSNTPGNGVTSYGLTTIPNAGLAGTPMTIQVNVDAPLQLRDSSNSWQYYRIRSIGTMPINGPIRTGDNRQDTRLRKLSLRWDRFTGGILQSQEVDTPRVSRRVETIVRPISSFDQAVISLGALNLNDADITIDSYDSRDPSKSQPNPDYANGPGIYDATKRQQHGNIATNGNLINAGNAHIYGDVATNAGTVSGATNVTGVQRTDFYQEPIPVGAPDWLAMNPMPMAVLHTTSLAASSVEASPASRYRLNTIDLSGGEMLYLTGKPDGSTTYIEIYVTGDITATGNSQIVVQPGVKAIIYFAGNVKVSGNGLVNKNNRPGDLQLFGITPPDGTSKVVELGGNGQLTAAVYAPGHDVQINNGGTRGTAVGSFVGKTFRMTGVTDLHYDEALASGGRVTNYKIVSWFEDTR
ncbi:MAG TPA: hypothetical protein VF551_07565 [Chthoniobacterales bacterium]